MHFLRFSVKKKKIERMSRKGGTSRRSGQATDKSTDFVKMSKASVMLSVKRGRLRHPLR